LVKNNKEILKMKIAYLLKLIIGIQFVHIL
jgi:hypothetical protein